MEAINLREEITDPVFGLIYGGSGTGKTHLTGTIAALGKTLVVDIDKGSKTLRTAKKIKPLHKNLTVVSFDKFGDLDNLRKLVTANDPAQWTKAIYPKGEGVITEKFDWVVYDSWSELQWNMKQQLRQEKGLLSANDSLVFRKGMEIQHWGMLTDLNNLCVETLRDIPGINQVFVMLETMSKDELSGQVFGGPAIHGKLVAEMPGYFDVVVHTSTDIMGKFQATTIAKGKWPAKTRLGEGKTVTDPTAKDFFVVEG